MMMSRFLARFNRPLEGPYPQADDSTTIACPAPHSLLASPSELLRPAIAAGLIAAGLYLSTLMLTVSGCGHAYCADVGEFQVALAGWGTVHHTGYPLYMLLGSTFVTGLRWLGVPPSAGASAYSLVWEVLAVIGLALIVMRLTGRAGLAFGAAFLFSVLQPIWVHGSIPEVYSLSMAISVAIVWVSLDLHEKWSDGKGWLLALLGGLAVAHHRLLMLLLVPVAFYLVPVARQGRRSWRWLALASLFFLAGFLPYLDLPIRVWRGATWNYGRPDTWDGFWHIFWGQEFAYLQKPNLSPISILSAAHDVLHLLRSEFTLLGLVIIGLGLWQAVRVRRSRSAALFFAGSLLITLAFAIIFREAVLLEAQLMLPVLALVILLALGLGTLPARGQGSAGLLVCAWGTLLAVRNYPFVSSLTHDPTAIIYAQQVEQLEAPPGAVVMAPWGASYFALAYAQRVEGRMKPWVLVDHRANLKELARVTTGRIYTASETLYVFNADWWAAQLGSPLRITSAGPGMMALTAQPLEAPAGQRYLIGDDLALVGWEVRPPGSSGQTDVVLYWAASRTPAADYSTYVHVTDQETITTPDELIAQSDYSSPVYGWYPTSRWQPNEVVREDHLVILPPDRVAHTIFVGMYLRDPSGNFIQLGQIPLRNINGEWSVRP